MQVARFASPHLLWVVGLGKQRKRCTLLPTTLGLPAIDSISKVNQGSYSVHTEALKLESLQQIHVTEENRVVLGLEFNDVPCRQDLYRYVKIRHVDSRKDVAFNVIGGVETPSVRLETKRIVDGHLRIMVSKELRGVSGPLRLQKDQVHDVTVTRAFTLRRMCPVSESFEKGHVLVELSQHPDLSTAAQHIVVDPPIHYTTASYGRGCRIKGLFEAGRTYSITLRAGFQSTSGVVLTQDVTRAIYFPDQPPGVSFDPRGEYLSSAGMRSINVSSVNTPTLDITAERIYPNNLVLFAMRRSKGRHTWSRHEDEISRETGSVTVDTSSAPANQVITNQVDLTELMGAYASGAYQLTARTKKGQIDRRLVVGERHRACHQTCRQQWVARLGQLATHIACSYKYNHSRLFTGEPGVGERTDGPLGPSVVRHLKGTAVSHHGTAWRRYHLPVFAWFRSPAARRHRWTSP